jgi:prolyl oligopeptidase
MRGSRARRSFVGCALILALLPWGATAQRLRKPPTTPTDDVIEVLHGVEIADPYRWLEEQWSPKTRAWIEEQNAYTRALLDAVAGRQWIRRRLAELMKVDAVGVPIERGGRYFFAKRRADQEQFVIYMRKGRQGPEEVVIDPHPWSPDHTTSVTLLDVSHDGTVLAYGVRQGGEDEITVRLFDVDARRDLPDVLPKGRYFGLSLVPDKSGFYYTRHTPEGPRVYFHKRGEDPARDREIFGRGYGVDKIITAELSDDGRYVLFTVSHGAGARRTEIYLQDAARGGPILPVVNDIEARFSGEIVGETLYLLTNWNAPRGRLLAVDVRDVAARDRWREVIPPSSAVITGFALVGGRLVVNHLENVQARVRVFDPTGRFLAEIPLPGIGSVSGLRGRWGSPEVFYAFSSFHIPTTIYRYDVNTGASEVWASLNVPIRSEQFEVTQVWYTSRDGTRIPMFIAHARGVKRDGARPTLLTGYGGFNVSLLPSFSARAVLWMELGGVYALPNLRGGGEFGEEWHRAGMLEKKQNVFDDFLAAAEWLIANGYTNPARLAISGGSNGGLLVGAALTQRPDLFAAVVCSYPLLDMVRYHRFLVARFWIPEYGSSDDPEQFRYLLAYSPYHRVRPGTRYPAVLFITGDADTRVDPLHARKMTARLQAATASDRPILLRYDTKAGHSGGLPLSKQIEDLTDEVSFLAWQLDVRVPEQ